jgi:hypothetical protein
MGHSVMLPKIKIISAADRDRSFKSILLQYPARLAFSMTMNKSQAQSLKYVGANVEEEVFRHSLKLHVYGAAARDKW